MGITIENKYRIYRLDSHNIKFQKYGEYPILKKREVVGTEMRWEDNEGYYSSIELCLQAIKKDYIDEMGTSCETVEELLNALKDVNIVVNCLDKMQVRQEEYEVE